MRPLNALTAFCLTLLLFALIGRWSVSTGVSGLVFTVLALVNYYTRDLHGTALMPQDILNIATAAEVMGSYTLRVTRQVVTIGVLFLPVLVVAVVQHFLAFGRGKAPRIGWRRRLGRWAGCAAGMFVILYVGYFAPFSLKPKSTYGWAWQNTYYTYGYLGRHDRVGRAADEPDHRAGGLHRRGRGRGGRQGRRLHPGRGHGGSEQEYPDVVLILSESFYDFDLVTDTAGRRGR